MRILVQNCKTSEFFKENGVWTKNCFDAREFSSSAEALEFCRSHPDTQVVFKFKDDKYDLTLPVTEGCRSGENQAVRIAITFR